MSKKLNMQEEIYSFSNKDKYLYDKEKKLKMPLKEYKYGPDWVSRRLGDNVGIYYYVRKPRIGRRLGWIHSSCQLAQGPHDVILLPNSQRLLTRTLESFPVDICAVSYSAVQCRAVQCYSVRHLNEQPDFA